MSDPMTNLPTALSKAQSQIKGALKDATNPHFKSKYADLASVWEACRKPLTDNGLSIVQYTETTFSDPHASILITRLLHVSGESVEGRTPLLMGKQDMQALGSAITYARRYALAAMVGISPEDDDGNAAVAEPVRGTAPDGYEKFAESLQTAAVAGTVALRAAFKKGTPEQRTYLSPETTEELKNLAAEADAAKKPTAISEDAARDARTEPDPRD